MYGSLTQQCTGVHKEMYKLKMDRHTNVRMLVDCKFFIGCTVCVLDRLHCIILFITFHEGC